MCPRYFALISLCILHVCKPAAKMETTILRIFPSWPLLGNEAGVWWGISGRLWILRTNRYVENQNCHHFIIKMPCFAFLFIYLIVSPLYWRHKLEAQADTSRCLTVLVRTLLIKRIDPTPSFTLPSCQLPQEAAQQDHQTHCLQLLPRFQHFSVHSSLIYSAQCGNTPPVLPSFLLLSYLEKPGQPPLSPWNEENLRVWLIARTHSNKLGDILLGTKHWNF